MKEVIDYPKSKETIYYDEVKEKFTYILQTPNKVVWIAQQDEEGCWLWGDLWSPCFNAVLTGRREKTLELLIKNEVWKNKVYEFESLKDFCEWYYLSDYKTPVRGSNF